MAKLAHWQTVASRIRRERGISWEEARAVYHRLSAETREEKGRRAGLTDIRTHTQLVRETSKVVRDSKRTTRILIETKGEREFPPAIPGGDVVIQKSFADMLEAYGVDPTAFLDDSKGFEEREIPTETQLALASLLGGARADIEETGYVNPRRKKAIQDFFLAHPEFMTWEYFSLQRRLY